MRHHHESIAIVCSDRATAITVATDLGSYVLPWGFTLTDVAAQLVAAGSGTFTVNILVNGSTIFGTKLTIDSGETSSHTAATPYRFKPLTTTTVGSKSIEIARGANVTIDVDGASGSPAGLIVTLIGIRHLL